MRVTSHPDPLPGRPLSRDGLEALGVRLADQAWAAGLQDWSWGEGTFLLGEIRFAESLGQPFPSRVLRYLDHRADAGLTVRHVNDLAPGTAAVLAAQATGDRRYLNLVEPLIDWVRTDPAATRAPNGALEHWPGSVWADTAFMAGLFIGHLGAAGCEPDGLAEFGRQLVAHAQLLQDAESGLYAHGSYYGETIRCYWGRGNAWCALAAVEFLELAATSPVVPGGLVDAVRGGLRRQLVSLAKLQPPHGVWDVLVDSPPDTAGLPETSAAAGIGAAMLRAAALIPDLPDEVATAGWRAVRGALAHVDAEGTLRRVSAGTILQLLPFGYSVIRDDLIQLWGQGLALHAAAAAISALEGGAMVR